MDTNNSIYDLPRGTSERECAIFDRAHEIIMGHPKRLGKLSHRLESGERFKLVWREGRVLCSMPDGEFEWHPSPGTRREKFRQALENLMFTTYRVAEW